MRFIDRLRHPPAPSEITEAVLLLIALRVITHERPTRSADEEAFEAHAMRNIPGLRGHHEAALEEAFALVVERHLEALGLEDFESAEPAERQALLLELTSDLRAAPRELLRKRCFTLAMEMAYVGGAERLTPGRDQILQHMYGVLGIAPDMAHKVARVLGIKYARRPPHLVVPPGALPTPPPPS